MRQTGVREIDRSVKEISVMTAQPASGAIVMGTGIVSVALSLDGRETLSRVLLALAACVWIGLGAVVVGRLRSDRGRLAADARTPAALTAVAATAVLGTRVTMLGWTWEAVVLLAISVALWLVLIPRVRLTARVAGSAFMLSVATESLALPPVELALRERVGWLVVAALVPFVVGLVLYVFVLARFELGELVAGAGDHWVSGGALAISALVAGNVALAAKGTGVLRGTALRDIAVAVWVVALLWLPVLVGAEALRVRLRYDLRRWSTVFPVGMYAACSFAVGAAVGAPAITRFARIWVWVALAVWLVVAAATVRSLARRA
jgi:tellurite resistance protein TehA-like permease